MAVKQTSANEDHSKKRLKIRFLPDDFVPSASEVVVGRGKKCTGHAGNQRLRRIVRTRLQEYASANDKTHKTYIISQIFNDVRKGSSCGGFVKKDADLGRWYRVEDSCARTNIAQAFRDELHETYRSSKFAKQRRRWVSIPGTNSDSKYQGSTEALQGARKLTASSEASSMKSMVYPTLVNSENSFYQQWREPEPLFCAAPSSGRDVTEIINDALDVMQNQGGFWQRQDPVYPFTTFSANPPSSSQDLVTFDTLLSLTSPGGSQVDPMDNPFEPKPIPELTTGWESITGGDCWDF